MDNSGINRFNLFGLPVDQQQDFLIPFGKLFQENNFKQIIDLGTGSGIFTMLLGIYGAIKNCEVYSFDIKEWSYHKLLPSLKINFEMANVIEDEKIMHKIAKIIAQNGQTLVLCDNGNKIKEFNYYAQFLKPNDVIMAHDYSTDRETMNKLNVWKWCEITLKDVKDCMKKYNLNPYFTNEFLKVAWLCTKKGVNG